REVLLCAGALESPKLLMLSGVGPGDALRAAGVDVIHALPGVGQNLHDHPNVTMFFRGDHHVDFFHPQLYGFTRANPRSALPPGQSDTCLVFYSGNASMREATKRMLPYKLFGGPGYSARKRDLTRRVVEFALRRRAAARLLDQLYGVVVILGKPRSRGSLTLRSPRAEEPARLDPGYFTDPEDMRTMLLGVRKARALAGAPALREWGNRELLPGPRARDDRALTRFIERNAMTTFHYAGTCRMGHDEHDEHAVVDARGRVRGITGLRVADASITPWTPVSAMNAPSMMIGRRVALFARADARA
ncbi:MAG: GMC family oxidoreductase, partial [Myxococcales bacterium]|nr:GMC family oxidoreductase [Myxococcales bacterium]